MKRIIIDLDDTICVTVNGDYENSILRSGIKEKLEEYRREGFEIVISTSRNMRTFSGNLGKINANTLPVVLDWLKKNDIVFDEIYMGKPWCGTEGFYVDDRAIRPDEFEKMSYSEIKKIIGLT